MKQDTSLGLSADQPKQVPGHIAGRTLQDVNFRVFGVREAVRFLDANIVAQQPTKLAIANAHTLNVARADAGYRKTLARFAVLNDGIGVDLASRLRYGQPFPANLNGTDFIPAYLAQTTLNLRVFMLGARPHVVQRAFDAARMRFPQHEWLGFRDGYFDPADEAKLCDDIHVERVDLLLVAMGNPLQEFWIDRCATATGATVCVGVGALFDFLSGEVSRAPDWARRLKIEWIYRLLQEPGRMWRRYLVGNTTFLWHAWRERRQR